MDRRDELSAKYQELLARAASLRVDARGFRLSASTGERDPELMLLLADELEGQLAELEEEIERIRNELEAPT
jgi:hypothetical protein